MVSIFCFSNSLNLSCVLSIKGFHLIGTLQSDRWGSNAIARHRDNHPVDFVCIGLESPRSSVNSDL